mgnify:CR=1 FL=1|jgi:hypothetical protein
MRDLCSVKIIPGNVRDLTIVAAVALTIGAQCFVQDTAIILTISFLGCSCHCLAKVCIIQRTNFVQMVRERKCQKVANQSL